MIKINYYTLSILFLFLTLQCMAQLPVRISGELQTKRNTVRLYKVEQGRLVEIAQSLVNGKGKFGFLFYPEYEGFYALGSGNASNPAENFTFYFKNGDQLEVQLQDSTYRLLGKVNSKENQVLQSWNKLTLPLYQKAINFMRVSSTFMDYFPQQEEIVSKSKDFLKDKKTGNALFDTKIKELMALDLASYASNFINTPRSAHPSVEEWSNFYHELDIKRFTNRTSSIYGYPYGQRVMSALIGLHLRKEKKAYVPGLEAIETFTSYLPNDTLKGDIVLDFIARYKTYDEYRAAMNHYGQYVLTSAQKERSEALMSPLLTYKTGTEALNFSFPDMQGKNVTLESLRGKVVLVDVWATWCGPCRIEFPHLKQLEKDIQGKPIQVVSISTDDPKDKEKWMKMIKEEELEGIQLFASGPGNEFSKYYKINSIPRFLVFDKNGKIVTVDAPRPSNPKLKELLYAEAAK